MNDNPEKSESKRDFLKSGLRALLGGGIVFISGMLGWREISYSEDEKLCVIVLPCRNCKKLTECTDPKAAVSKQDISSEL